MNKNYLLLGTAFVVIVTIGFIIHEVGMQKGYSEGVEKGKVEILQNIPYEMCTWKVVDEGNLIQDCEENVQQEVSIITEEKKCEDLDGDFDIVFGKQSAYGEPYRNEWNTFPDGTYTLTCTSPAKELFNIKVK